MVSEVWSVSNHLHKPATIIVMLWSRRNPILSGTPKECVFQLRTVAESRFLPVANAASATGAAASVKPNPWKRWSSFVGDLWFVEGAPTDDQSALPDWVALGTSPNREKGDADSSCGLVLFAQWWVRPREK